MNPSRYVLHVAESQEHLGDGTISTSQALGNHRTSFVHFIGRLGHYSRPLIIVGVYLFLHYY